MRCNSWVALAVALIVSGCLDRRADTVENDTTNAEANAMAAAHGRDTAAKDAAAADTARGLAVEGEGLRVFSPAGSALPIPFGTPIDDVMSKLVSTEGRGPIAQGENEDCGANFARWESGLTAWFSKGKFVGWSLDDAGAKVTTGDLAGLLDSEKPDARVKHLWAGVTCNAR